MQAKEDHLQYAKQLLSQATCMQVHVEAFALQPSLRLHEPQPLDLSLNVSAGADAGSNAGAGAGVDWRGDTTCNSATEGDVAVHCEDYFDTYSDYERAIRDTLHTAETVCSLAFVAASDRYTSRSILHSVHALQSRSAQFSRSRTGSSSSDRDSTSSRSGSGGSNSASNSGSGGAETKVYRRRRRSKT